MSTTTAIRMYKGKGSHAVTHYSCGVIEKAKSLGMKITIARRNKKTGKVELVDIDPNRTVHRTNLQSVYADTHELAGQGKYISEEAYTDESRNRIVGAQYVNPYLKEDGASHTIIESFKHNIGKKHLAKLRAVIARNVEKGTHILWEGRRNSDGALVVSDLMTAVELWKLAQELNPEIQKMLRKSKSGRKGVRVYRSAREKFFIDLDVLRRSTCVLDIGTGKRTIGGGCTPYSKPIEQCGFAIDKRFLTFNIDKNGNEEAQYYYQFVIGRSEAHNLPHKSWVYEGVNSRVAFLNETVRNRCKKILTAA